MKISLSALWNMAKADPAPEQAAKDELRALIDKIGIVRFAGRMYSGVLPDYQLAAKVMDEYVEKSARPPFMVRAMRAIFS